jgi:hypothetical protein
MNTMATATQQTLSIGSWSTGTMRTEDIAQTLIGMAHYVGIDANPNIVIVAEWDDDGCDGLFDYETINDAIADAIDVLQEYAPMYCYVGASEYDPADFGVFPSDDAIQEAIRTGVELVATDRNGAGSTINVEDGVIIDVNDHGNVTISTIERGTVLLELV